jgi:hypothetical protein
LHVFRPLELLQTSIGFESNTESKTIFSGHGEASPIAMSTTIAAATMRSHLQYGRTSRSANGIMPAGENQPQGGASRGGRACRK